MKARLIARRRWLAVVAGALAAIVLPGPVGAADLMAGMTLVSQGRFRDSDILHRGSGDAMVYRRADGSLLLRLDNFRVTAGPDLFVYLARHAAPENMKDVKKGFLSIARLKANTGTQDYELPAGTALAEYGSVVVYCQVFGVLFSAAPLTAAIG